MAPRYGGDHEDLSRAIREAQQLQRETDELTQKESVRADATRKSARSDETAVSRSRELGRARREAEDVARRSARVADVEVKATQQTTEAIERNRRARERAIETQRRAEAMQRGALQGARDPLFAQASAMAGQRGAPSQYQLRRELAVGQQRAARLQAAAVAGFRPAGAQEARFPATRSMAAEVAVQRAEGDLARATRELTNVRRRKGVSDEEITDHVQRRDAARAQREAARTELESARKQADTVERVRQQEASRKPGTELIRHPELYGQRPGPSIPMGAGGGGRPGVIAEGGPGHGGGRAFAPPINTSAGTRAATVELNEYTRALSEVERQSNRAREARVDEYMGRVAAEQQRAAAATQAAGVNFGMASQQMMRHGALSSEFIVAAARGEATIREMGNQALITAGKFAGWITVGAGIYALADAARQVGQGAIAASSGVEQLNRVVNVTDREGASESFADLAGQFNVPIEVAADAVYRMGQVYHDQEQAAKAAEAALTANVAGGMGIEEGTSGLISIAQAWGLASDELVGVFDQVNAAQNNFGATIPDIVAGMAKASGSYQQAGGDLNYLLALMTAIQRATRRTGQEIGTGLSRGVNMFSRPVSVKRLESQGVEVDPENFQKTIQSAMKAARRPNADINEIARGLMGNEYARLLTPVLANQDVLNRARKETSPTEAAGSGAREVAKVLSQVDQQMQAVGIGLQQIGEALARSGALAPLLLMLKALNGSLDLANGLLNIFNEIPAPLRQAVVLLAEGYVLLQAMRKLGGTDALAGGQLGFLADPDKRLQTYAKRGLRDQTDMARNEYENYSRGESRAAISREIAAREQADFKPELDRARQLPVDHPDRVQADRRAESLESNRIASERKLARASAEASGAREVLRRSEEDLTAVERLRTNQVRDYLQKSGYALPNDIEKPSSAGTTVLTRGGTDFDVPGDRHNRLRALAQESRQWSDNAVRYTGQMQAALGSLYTAGGRIDREARPLGVVSQRLYNGSGRLVNSLGNAISFIDRAADSMRGSRGKMMETVRAMGALDFALITFAIGSVIDGAIDPLTKDLDELDKALGRTQNSNARLRDVGKRIKEFEGRGTVNTDDWLTRLNDVANPVEVFGSTLPEIFRGDYETPGQRAHRLEEQARRTQEEIRNRRELQADASRRGAPRPTMNIEDVQRDIQRTHDLRRDNIITQAEFDRRMANHAVEIKTAYFPSRVAQVKAQAALSDALRAFSSDSGDYRKALKALPEKELEAQAKGVAAQMEAFGPGGDELEQARAIYGEAVARWGSKTDDAAAMTALAQSRDAYFTLIQRTSDNEVKRSLLLARNEGDRRDAYSDASQFVRRNITDNARNRLNRNQGMLEESEGRISGLQSQRAPGMPASQRQELETAIAAELKRAAQLRRAVGRSRTELRAAERKAEELQAELRQAAYDDREQGRGIRLALGQARDPDEADQARMAVQNAEAQVRDAATTFGRNSRQYQTALTGLFQARTQAAQAAVNDIRAENALLTAQAGDDPVAQARAGLQGARAIIAQLNGADRARYSDAERTQAQADLINAQNAYDNATADQARRLAELQGQIAAARAGDDPVAQARAALAAARIQTANADGPVESAEALLATIQANNQLESALADRELARMKMLASRTDDPVAAARAERIAAARAVSRATPGTEGYYEAQTRLNEARRAEVQAQLDSTTGDIEFERTMGTLSVQDAIDRYQTLLETRNLSKQQKRDILTRIKGLEDEAESESQGFNLDVGSLKLPTAYDVRRAFDPIREGVRSQVKEAQRAITGEDHGAGRRGGRINVNRDSTMNQDLSSSVSNMYDQRAQVTANLVVNVMDRGSVAEVYEALDRVLGTTVRSKARSAGRR